MRFNKPELIRRIRQIGRYSNRIRLYQQDTLRFVRTELPKLGRNTFVFLDPPYIEKGVGLYLNEYTDRDHELLSRRVQAFRHHWAVTYDLGALERQLYPDHRRLVYDLHYTAQDRYRAREVMFLADSLRLPPLRQLLGPRMVAVPEGTRLDESKPSVRRSGRRLEGRGQRAAI